MLKEEKENVENPLVSMVDYIRVTFKTHDVDHIIEAVYNPERNQTMFSSDNLRTTQIVDSLDPITRSRYLCYHPVGSKKL